MKADFMKKFTKDIHYFNWSVALKSVDGDLQPPIKWQQKMKDVHILEDNGQVKIFDQNLWPFAARIENKITGFQAPASLFPW